MARPPGSCGTPTATGSAAAAGEGRGGCRLSSGRLHPLARSSRWSRMDLSMTACPWAGLRLARPPAHRRLLLRLPAGQSELAQLRSPRRLAAASNCTDGWHAARQSWPLR
eukprot:1423564-Heterocapsa_arctica.AAC.1